MNLCWLLFCDVCVCQVFDFVFDFEWLNCQLFYSVYMCFNSYFVDIDLQVIGMLGEGELKLLELLCVQFDLVVFGLMVMQLDIYLLGLLCVNLLKVCVLFVQIGWIYCDGVLCNVKGELFVFEIFDDVGGVMEGVVIVYQCNFVKFGIVVWFCMVDYVLL